MSINAGDAKMDVALQLGLASEAALLEDFEFASVHLFRHGCNWRHPGIKYTDPGMEQGYGDSDALY